MTESAPGFIKADWPVSGVRAGTTTRIGGVSRPPYTSFNLAAHVDDDSKAVQQNRARLRHALDLAAEPVWLEQVHGNVVVDAAAATGRPRADASFTTARGVACAVLTADCLPVLFATPDGQAVAAAHAGWRGLAGGVLEATVDSLMDNTGCDASDILAWMGPAIGQDAFEVGGEVVTTFTAIDPVLEAAFTAGRRGHWQADIYTLGRKLLNRKGVTRIYGGGFCTFHDEGRFYSYRRAKQTGRMASLVWIA